MIEEKNKKVDLAISKLIGFKVGSHVIITQNSTGHTMSHDGSREMSWDKVYHGFAGKEAVIVEILEDRVPTGYYLDCPGVSSRDVWAEGSFILKGN